MVMAATGGRATNVACRMGVGSGGRSSLGVKRRDIKQLAADAGYWAVLDMWHVQSILLVPAPCAVS